jgi:hypothetical protein
MTKWVHCTTTDGTEVRVNLDHVAIIRPYRSDRGFTGSEIIFASAPSSILVQEDRDTLVGPPTPRQARQVP